MSCILIIFSLISSYIKKLLNELKDIFINFREIAIIFIISPSCRINENINLIKILIDFYNILGISFEFELKILLLSL